jgi:hypothetical protein
MLEWLPKNLKLEQNQNRGLFLAEIFGFPFDGS